MIICVVRKINITTKNGCNRTVEYRNFKYFNCQRFQEDLTIQPWHLIDNKLNVSDKWSMWKALFLGVLDAHAPIRVKRVKSNRSIPWLNKNIKLLLFERDRPKLKATNLRSGIDWKACWALRNRVNITIWKEKEKCYKNFINKSNNPIEVWKTINILGRKQEHSMTCNLKIDDKIISWPQKITECFNDYFTDVGAEIANSAGKGKRNFSDNITTIP